MVLQKSILKFCQRIFVILSNYLSLEKGMALFWINLSPLHQSMLCAKFGWNWLSGFGVEIFLISSIHFQYFVIIPPWKGRGPAFEQIWIPFTQRWFVPSLVEIGLVVLEEKMKMWKVYDNNNINNDAGGQRTNCDQKHSLEPSAQVN